MKNLFKRKAMAIVLSLALVFQMGVPAYATGESLTIGASGITTACTHHTHDKNCGYSEGTPCTHEHTEECYTEVTNCTHEHTDECYTISDSNVKDDTVVDSGVEATPADAEEKTLACVHVCDDTCVRKSEDCNYEHIDCGYAEGAPCNFSPASCEICNPKDSGKAECICDTLCLEADAEKDIEAQINADCPVCSVEDADLAACTGAAAMMMMARAGDTPNGATISMALDFTQGTPPADCTKLSTGAHTHNGTAKCFTWAGNTLTLKNLNLEVSTAATALKLPDGATVDMGGTSTVTSTYNDTDDTYGIHGVGVLTFSGSGSLNANGGTSTSNNSYGVYAAHDITVSGGTLTANGGQAGTSGSSYGVRTGNGDITVSGTGTLTATGGQASTSGNSYGASVYNNFRKITVSSGTFEAKTTDTDGGTAQAVNKQPDTTGYTNVKLSAGTAVDSLGVVTNLDGFAGHKHIKIEPGVASANVAKIGSTEYPTVQAAVDVVTTGQTVELLANVALTETLTIASNTPDFTLDLKTYTLSLDFGFVTIHNKGTLTIAGGTVSGRGIYNEGTLTIAGGTVSGAGSSGINNRGTVTVEGGEVSSSNDNSIYNHASGRVTVKGGTVSGRGISNEGTVTVEGGTIDGGTGTGISGSGAVTIEVASGKTAIVKGSVKAMTTAPTLTNSKVTAYSDYTCTTEETYNSATMLHKYLKFEPKAVAPTYTITASPTSKDFGSATVGYGTTPTAETITIENTGNQSVTLNQPTSTKYDVGTLTTTTLVAGATATFTIAPKTGLAEGSHNETITISTTNGTSATVAVSFAVTAAGVDVSSIDTAIAAANTAKNGIAVNDNPASSVPNGTKFVTTAEMGAFTAAINTATAAKSTVTTTDEAKAAAAALDSAVATFKAAIKTGTYTSGGGSTGGGGTSGGGSTGGGGSSSGGGSDNSTITTPPVTAENPKPATEVTTTVKPTVSGGTATVNVSNDTINSAIQKAQEEAKKNGTTANGIVVEIKVDTKNTTANNLTANLPKASVDVLVKANTKEVRITSGIADIHLNLDTLKEIQKQVGTDVNVAAKRADSTTLSADAKKLVGNRPVYDFSITGANGKKITDFGKGKVSVSIPYTLGANEVAANVVAYYIDNAGKVSEMPNSVYNPINKTLSFVTDDFSKFAVGYKDVKVTFTDTSSHWAKDSIEFVVARGILAGTGNNKFSPNTAMTRGMFVTALGRLAEADVSQYTKSSFTDVKADTYYMGYVEWASKNGIVNGMGNGKFAPDQSITREQMAVIMANYTKAIGFALPKVHAENVFADNSKIGSYAKDAVKQMQMAGILSGKSNNQFDPQGTATRAEVSAVLKRFVELVINTDSAEGWTVNDSGKWMYYENGKAVTGKKNINGVSYTFDQYGVTKDTPKDLTYGTHTVVKNESWWSIASKYKCSMFELARINNKTIFSMLYVGDTLKVPESK